MIPYAKQVFSCCCASVHISPSAWAALCPSVLLQSPAYPAKLQLTCHMPCEIHDTSSICSAPESHQASSLSPLCDTQDALTDHRDFTYLCRVCLPCCTGSAMRAAVGCEPSPYPAEAQRSEDKGWGAQWPMKRFWFFSLSCQCALLGRVSNYNSSF